MLLIGMLDSPFVRRVAISMKLLGVPFEHGNWSVGRDFERIRQYNPLVKVPTLILDDGEMLCESAAILDYLDEQAGPERALLPARGAPRRQSLKLMSIATATAEKARDQIYEQVFRPEHKRHDDWLDRLRTQMHGGLAELERYAGERRDGWLIGQTLTQADITVTCAVTFVSEALELGDWSRRYPHLAVLVGRCETRPEFRATHEPFFPPNKSSAQSSIQSDS